MSGLAGLALVGSGSTPECGPHARHVRRTVSFCLTEQQPDGLFAAPAEESRTMYGHGFAMLFLSQVYGMEEDVERQRRIRVGLEKKTRFGREVQGAIWVHREWETLRAMAEDGAPVPRPIASTEDAILMTYVGDEGTAAPQLHRVRPSIEEAQDLFDQLVRTIERFLYRNVIHGDLSPYNVLVWEGRATVLDLPQAVDPRKWEDYRGEFAEFRILH